MEQEIGAKSVHIVSSLESEAAGTRYTVTRIAGSVAEYNGCAHLVSIGETELHVGQGVTHWVCRPEYRWLDLNRKLLISPAMKKVLNALEPIDVVHSHGIWRMPNIYAATFARRRGLPLVLSPHGMLGREALQFSRIKKSVFWTLAQGKAIREVSCFHATSEQEYHDVREAGLKQPVAIIPHGIDLPELDLPPQRMGIHTRPYVVSLGRIHPKKALADLVRAWALVNGEFPDWDLRIVGPSEIGYADELRALAKRLHLSSVRIEGPVFGQEKFELLTNAELFALSTLHENFGITVPESLVCGTPVISTTGAPWQGLVHNSCGWWIERGVSPMAQALREALTLSPEERRAMGLRGREWMRLNFTWSAAGKSLVELYRWLRGGRIPDFVRTD